MINKLLSQALRADDDVERVESAGLGASQRCLARIRSGFARMLASRGAYHFSAQAELLNHLVPVMAKTMAVSHLMGERRTILNWRDAKLEEIKLAWDESKHPREPSGTHEGGQFASVTESDAFKRWFGDSKVVDKDGKPLIVYHGTSEKFTAFDPERKGERDSGDYGKGFYFTASKANAEMYSEWAKGGGPSKKRGRNVMAVYLSLKRPFVMKDDMDEGTARRIVDDASANRVRLGKEPLANVEDHSRRLRNNYNSASEIVNKTKERARILSNYVSTSGLERLGYDGIIGTNEIVAFHPHQIKSATGNRGSFDPDDPDIRMAMSFGITGGFALDRFSEVMRQIRASGVGRNLSVLQRGYARLLYDQMRETGAKIDATTRATIASLIADREPPGRALRILQATLDKLGVGSQSQAQLETLYRTEVNKAYSAGQLYRDKQRWGDIWGFRYVTMRDDAVRPTHASWDGTTLPKNHKFWKTHWCPCGWNCRCRIATIYKTPGVKPREVQPGKINGFVAEADDGFGEIPAGGLLEVHAFA